MEKLYKAVSGKTWYWEYWDNDDGTFTTHWGELGTRGESRVIEPGLIASAESKLETAEKTALGDGYEPVPPDEHRVVLIEYPIDGMGSSADVEKRHRLQTRMDETLGWTGLGHCDGGSIGSGTMEVCCIVVDAVMAIRVIKDDLTGTEFDDYTRVFDEDADVD